MANRAYLFPTDHDEQWTPDCSGEGVYYDSRHTIPIAWWFLFEPADLRLIEREEADPVRPRQPMRLAFIRLRCNRAQAIARFVNRRPLVHLAVKGRIEACDVDFFEAILRNWSGQYLVMDPDEILEATVDNDFARLKRVLEALSPPKPDMDAFLSLLGESSTMPAESDALDKRVVKVLGYTYGELANRLTREMGEGNRKQEIE